MKMWLDDTRPMPDGYDFWAKTGEEAIHALKVFCVDKISFDHDLGDGKTGYDVACYIELLAAIGNFYPMPWEIHSANPVGRRRINQAMKNAEKFWKKYRE